MKQTNRLKISIFRSNKAFYAQIIDTKKSQTLASASSLSINPKSCNIEISRQVGESVAQKALKKGISKVYLDRGKYKYHGGVKAFAEGARSAGLIF